MSFEILLDASRRVATLVVHGICAAADLRAIVAAIRTDPRITAETAFLWDIRGATIAFTSEELEHLVAGSVPYAQQRGSQRTAVVATAPVSYGFARLTQAYVALWGSPVDVRIFATVEAATAWLLDSPAASAAE